MWSRQKASENSHSTKRNRYLKAKRQNKSEVRQRKCHAANAERGDMPGSCFSWHYIIRANSKTEWQRPLLNVQFSQHLPSVGNMVGTWSKHQPKEKSWINEDCSIKIELVSFFFRVNGKMFSPFCREFVQDFKESLKRIIYAKISQICL